MNTCIAIPNVPSTSKINCYETKPRNQTWSKNLTCALNIDRTMNTIQCTRIPNDTNSSFLSPVIDEPVRVISTVPTASLLVGRTNDTCAYNIFENEERIDSTSLKRRRRVANLGIPKKRKRIYDPLIKKQNNDDNIHCPKMKFSTHRYDTELLRISRPKMVRFASTVTVIRLNPEDDEEKKNRWYERSEYASFGVDCRRSIILFRSVLDGTFKGFEQVHPQVIESNTTTVEVVSATPNNIDSTQPPSQPFHQQYLEFTVHGLEDFISLEAKQLHTKRRLLHCYNVLYHQWLNDQDSSNDTLSSAIVEENAIRLQHVAQCLSFKSMQLALIRGQPVGYFDEYQQIQHS
jgi:hypothetical protein